MSEGTAYGKIIVLGEHAVVYGRPALAVGLRDGARAIAAIETGARRWRLAGEAPHPETDRALDALVGALPIGPSGGVVTTELRVPPGGGLGASAALGVSIARAIGSAALARPLTLDETLGAAEAWERVFHGNPSGVDHTIAARGGAGVFSRSEGFTPLRLASTLRLVVADSGERTPTKQMVEQVARIRARRETQTEQTFDAIASLVRNGALALAAGDLRGLGQLMDLDQALLSSLFLSTERIEALCAAARSAGAFGAKLTGGGGGGCVIALVGPSERAVQDAWKALGAATLVAEIAGNDGAIDRPG